MLQRGPFNAWLRSPELGERLQKVGEYIRFNTSLPLRLNEFAILITARHWTSQYEWYAHLPLALKAGLDTKIADQLALNTHPAGMKEDEAAVSMTLNVAEVPVPARVQDPLKPGEVTWNGATPAPPSR